LKKDEWPCNAEDMNYVMGPEFAKNGWTLQFDCEYGLAAIVFDKNGRQYYRTVYFEDGKIEERPM
jgi:hypothetical protein